MKQEWYEEDFRNLEKIFGDQTPSLILGFSLLGWKNSSLFILDEENPSLRGFFLERFIIHLRSTLEYIIKRSKENPEFRKSAMRARAFYKYQGRNVSDREG